MTAAEVTRTYPLIPYTLLKRLRDFGYGPAYLSIGTRTYYSVTAIESYFKGHFIDPAVPTVAEVVEPEPELLSRSEVDRLMAEHNGVGAIADAGLLAGLTGLAASLKVNGQTVELSEEGQSYLNAAANILGAFEFEVTDEEE
jgi:hypothetical protein